MKTSLADYVSSCWSHCIALEVTYCSLWMWLNGVYLDFYTTLAGQWIDWICRDRPIHSHRWAFWCTANVFVLCTKMPHIMHTCDNFCIKSIFIYNKGSILRNVILLSFTIMVLVIIPMHITCHLRIPDLSKASVLFQSHIYSEGGVLGINKALVNWTEQGASQSSGNPTNMTRNAETLDHSKQSVMKCYCWMWHCCAGIAC